MIIPDVALLAFSLGAGILAGLFFFGGLWWTVRKLASTKRIKLVLFGSFIIRTAVLLIILYFGCGGDLIRIACYMIGFIIVRAVLIRKIAYHPIKGSERSDQ